MVKIQYFCHAIYKQNLGVFSVSRILRIYPLNLGRVMPIRKGRMKILTTIFYETDCQKQSQKKCMRILIILVFVFFSLQSIAQSDSLKTQDSIYKRLPLSEVKISGIRKKDLGPSCILTKTRVVEYGLFNYNGDDIPQILDQMNNVVSNADAGLGVGYTSLRLRGSDITRINVSMNGVPINDPESQATFFVDFPDIISSANSINLSSGIGDARSGYGNFGGGIAINNLNAGDENAALSINNDFSSFNTLKNTLILSTGLLHEKFKSQLRISRLRSDGYIQRSNANLFSIHSCSEFKINPKSKLIFNFLTGHEITGQAWNGVAENMLDSIRNFNELGDKGDGTFYNNQVDNYRQNYYQLFYDNDLSNKLNVGANLFYTKGKGYYEEFKLQQAYANYGLQNFVTGNDTVYSTNLIRQLWLDNDFLGGKIYANFASKSLEANLSLHHSSYLGKHFGEIIWAEQGIENDYRWYNLKANKIENNAIGMLAYHFKNRISLFGNLNVRNISYDIFGFRNYPTLEHHLQWTFLNPKFEINYRSKNERNFMRASIAQAAKEPNRNDFETSTQQLPKAEKMHNVEMSYFFMNEKHDFQFNFNFYYMQYKDQLILTGKINDVGAYTRENVTHSYRSGVELWASKRFLNNSIELNGNISLNKNKISNYIEYIDDYDNGGQIATIYKNTDIAFSPKIVAAMSFSLKPFYKNIKKKFVRDAVLKYNFKYVGRQFLDNTQNINKQLVAFTTSDLITEIPFSISKKNKITCRVRSGIYNIFNALYSNNGYTYSYIYNGLQRFNYYFPQAGRRFGAGFSFDF